ncbi:hypothetical protein AYW79_13090 [Ferroacidibacillus organovorans]|uniref:Uncharacterized protein n=1 Tax=Ferroacidibacillus organovorans TaxID=1765683 RepID=A0A162SHI9_9BACL|nr:hypothetical protein AYJ22_13515 [Ferroacidibacillus organovorans]OAG92869.1 hypothetical protein AYW79_13090 [Ferroacidibacillus organovorans]OPG16951.1 hypothetical protein B2M26_03850 [Ferroacidibacillus organovorans]
MASHTDLCEPNCHQTSDAISGNVKTFTFDCGNIVIRLTCNEPSKEAVENFQTALHSILHRMTTEGRQTGGNQDR